MPSRDQNEKGDLVSIITKHASPMSKKPAKPACRLRPCQGGRGVGDTNNDGLGPISKSLASAATSFTKIMETALHRCHCQAVLPTAAGQLAPHLRLRWATRCSRPQGSKLRRLQSRRFERSAPRQTANTAASTCKGLAASKAAGGWFDALYTKLAIGTFTMFQIRGA